MIIHLISLAFAEPLSIEIAMQDAMKNNLQLQRAEYELSSAQAQINTAKAIFDPNLTSNVGRNFNTQQQFFAGFGVVNTEFFGPTWSLGSNISLPTGGQVSLEWQTSRSQSRYTFENNPVNQEISPYDTNLTLNISQNLLDGFGLKVNLQPITSSKRAADISTLSYQATQQQILADVASTYWSARYQQELHQIAIEAIEIANEEARIVAIQVAEGNLASVEQDRVEASRLAALSAAADAKQAQETTLDNLRLLLDIPLGTPIELVSNPPTPIPNRLDLDSVLAKADQNSPTLKQSELAVVEAESQLAVARNERLPDLNASAQYSLNGWEEELTEAIDEMMDASIPSSYFGLNLSIPIRNLRYKGNLGQRIASLETAKIDLNSQRQILHQQVTAQLRTIESTLIKIELAKANLRVAEATLSADRALRDAGRSIEKDVLSSIRGVDEAKNQLERALADYQLARIEIDRLTGQLKKP